MKQVRLTPKEIARADYQIPELPFTIVVRPQADGTFWVAAVNVDTGYPLGRGNLAQMIAEDRSGIPDAVRSVGRDLHKFMGIVTDMTDRMRHKQYKYATGSSRHKIAGRTTLRPPRTVSDDEVKLADDIWRGVMKGVAKRLEHLKSEIVSSNREIQDVKRAWKTRDWNEFIRMGLVSKEDAEFVKDVFFF